MSNEESVVFLITRSTHAVSSIGGAAAIFYIWRCYYFRQHEKMGKAVDDFGLLWLAAAYLIWAGLSLYQFSDMLLHRKEIWGYQPKFDAAIAFLSPFNNACFLCSFIYFEHGFSVVRYLKKRWVWFGIVAVATLFAITVNLILVANGQDKVARIIDFMYSSVTLVFLGLLLIMAFNSRSLPGLSILALMVISASIFAQAFSLQFVIPDVVFSDPYHLGIVTTSAIYLISHTMLIALFISLAFTWIIEEEGVLDRFLKDQKIWDFYNKYRFDLNNLKIKLREQITKGNLLFVIEVLTLHFQEKKDYEQVKGLEGFASTYNYLEKGLKDKSIELEDWQRNMDNLNKQILGDFLEPDAAS